MSDQPETHRALEFGFTHGEPLFVDTVVGRDLYVLEPEHLRVTLNHPDGPVEVIVVELARLNYYREATYVVQPAPKDPSEGPL